jgi:hypothetical protein
VAAGAVVEAADGQAVVGRVARVRVNRCSPFASVTVTWKVSVLTLPLMSSERSFLLSIIRWFLTYT